MMSPILTLLPAFIALAGQQATTQPANVPPATQPTTRQEAPPAEPTSAEEGRKVAEMWIQSILASRPQAEPGRLADLLAARLENGFLLVELKAVPERWPLVMPLSDRPGSVVELAPIRRQRMMAEEESPANTRFRMFVHHLGKPGDETFSTDVELYSGPLVGQLNLSMVQSRVAGSQTVTLIQLPSGLEQEVRLRLHIQKEGGEGEEDLYERVEAESFQELSRREPELFNAFVRPMLLEIGLEAVVGGDVRKVATQLFLPELPVEAGVQEKVAELAAQLDSPEFEVREQAQRELEAMGRPAATALSKLAGEKQLSMEQMSRVENILAPFRVLTDEEARARRDNVEFLREAAALAGSPEDEALAQLAAARLKELGAESPPATRPAGE